MSLIRSARWLFGAAGTVLLWGLAQGCGPSVASFCDRICECTGCTDDQRTGCVDDIQDQEKAAGEAGCSGEWDSYFACANNELECVNEIPSADGCDAESSALLECAGSIPGLGGSCTSLCERANQCDGVTANSDCAGACADSQAQADGAGCSAEWDGIVACSAQRDDICDTTDTSCNDEAQQYVNCFVKFCTDNPDDKICTG